MITETKILAIDWNKVRTLKDLKTILMHSEIEIKENRKTKKFLKYVVVQLPMI